MFWHCFKWLSSVFHIFVKIPVEVFFSFFSHSYHIDLSFQCPIKIHEKSKQNELIFNKVWSDLLIVTFTEHSRTCLYVEITSMTFEATFHLHDDTFKISLSHLLQKQSFMSNSTLLLLTLCVFALEWNHRSRSIVVAVRSIYEFVFFWKNQ